MEDLTVRLGQAQNEKSKTTNAPVEENIDSGATQVNTVQQHERRIDADEPYQVSDSTIENMAQNKDSADDYLTKAEDECLQAKQVCGFWTGTVLGILNAGTGALNLLGFGTPSFLRNFMNSDTTGNSNATDASSDNAAPQKSEQSWWNELASKVTVGGTGAAAVAISSLGPVGTALAGTAIAMSAVNVLVTSLKKTPLGTELNAKTVNLLCRKYYSKKVQDTKQQMASEYMCQRYILQGYGDSSKGKLRQKLEKDARYKEYGAMHLCCEKLTTDAERHAFERAYMTMLFAKDDYFRKIEEENAEKKKKLECGIEILLLRACLARTQEISPEKARMLTDITAKYLEKDRGVKPNLKVDTDADKITWKEENEM